MNRQLEEDIIPGSLLKKMKPNENGRMEVTGRIYEAICQIPTGDLSDEQREIIVMERKAAYERWSFECKVAPKDGFQGKRGWVATKKQHLKNVKAKYATKSAAAK